jgi:hypothetical protein
MSRALLPMGAGLTLGRDPDVNHCMRHYEETVAGHCRSCGQPFCSRCLVYAFGPKKPPYCVGCALYASGVRSGTRHVAAPVVQQVLEVPETEISPSAVPGTVGLPVAAVGAVPVQDKRAERAYRRAQRTAEKQAVKAAKKTARRGAPADAEPGAPDLAPLGHVPSPGAPLATHEPV